MWTKTVLTMAIVCVAAGGLRAQNKPAAPAAGMARPNTVTGQEYDDRTRAAIEKGLAWLATRQQPDGAFGAPNAGYGAHSGISALCGVAFLAGGNTPDRGKYGEQVRKLVDWYVTKSSQENGLLAADSSHGVMYSHGFATLFMGEVYGMTGDERVKEKLQRAVKIIQKTQSKEGGWRYMPVPYDADISVTICEVMGLRAARDAGIKVEKEVFDKAIGYVKRCQNPDGGFSYVANQGGGGGSGFERTGAGTAALYYAGAFEDGGVQKGLDYLKQALPGKGAAAGRLGMGHYYYGHYYACQAMFLAGGDYWAKWYPAIRDELLKKQTAAGGWPQQEVSEEYSTAISLIILQMPNRYLPVFHGKGQGS